MLVWRRCCASQGPIQGAAGQASGLIDGRTALVRVPLRAELRADAVSMALATVLVILARVTKHTQVP